MTGWCARMAVLAVLFVASAASGQRSVRETFMVDRARPQWAVALMPGAEEVPGARSEMLDELSGVAARLDRRAITELTRLTAGVRRDDPVEPVALFWTIVIGKGDGEARVEIYRDARGLPFASRQGTATRFVPLNPVRFAQLSEGWASRDLAVIGEEIPVGRVVRFDGRVVPGRVALDRETIGDRIYRGQRVRISAADRDLDAMTLFVRLPLGYDEASRSGVIAWIDPTDRGVPPESLFRGADELGLILVGVADMGNQRPVMDRFQAVFDSVETVGRRWRIDRERVYAVGMSGGGRAASMLWGCFPDVFAGAVPIVGLNSYRRAVVDRREAPATFTRPNGRLLGLLRERRIAPMSGPLDFNYDQMKAYAAGLEEDRMQLRFFEYPDMAHTMPTPERFADAMEWVDEPRRRAVAEVEALGEAMWDEYVREFGEGVPATDEGWERLEGITEAAPWSGAAWRAAEMIAERDALVDAGG